MLNPRNQIKVNLLHEILSSVSIWRDVSQTIIQKMDLPTKEVVPWKFYENLETGKFVSQDVHQRTADGETALHSAAMMNLPEISQALIESNVDVNAVADGGWAALHFAAIQNNCEIGRILIKANADVHIKMSKNVKRSGLGSGRTALQFAAEKNCLEMGRILLDAGADGYAKSRFGETPMSETRTEEFKNMILSYEK
jgi:ankyrin repeat protein